MAFPAPHASGAVRLDPQDSDRIRIGRTVCIFMMMFVHVQPGVADNVNARPAEGVFDIVYFLLTRVMGLSSVALLSIVSGYLIVSTIAKMGPLRLYRSKAQTLLVPLVAWNAVMLACIVGYGLLSGKWDKLPALDAMGLANGFLAITEWPMVVPLWFLRDLFVCCLFTPILLAGLRRAPLATAGALLLFAFFGEPLHLLQRPPLMLFFAAGLWLRERGLSRDDLDRIAAPLSLALLPIVAVFLVVRMNQGSIVSWSEDASTALDIALRFSMAAAIWRLTGLLATLRFGKLCRELEPYVFFAFCSHAILFDYGQILLRRAFGNYGSDLFPITFFGLPFAALATSVVALQIIGRVSPLLYLLNAGRAVPSWPPQLERPQKRAAVSPEARRHRT